MSHVSAFILLIGLYSRKDLEDSSAAFPNAEGETWGSNASEEYSPASSFYSPSASVGSHSPFPSPPSFSPHPQYAPPPALFLQGPGFSHTPLMNPGYWAHQFSQYPSASTTSVPQYYSNNPSMGHPNVPGGGFANPSLHHHQFTSPPNDYDQGKILCFPVHLSYADTLLPAFDPEQSGYNQQDGSY